MEMVSTREFRSNQGKFLTAARAGESVVLTSRYGNFKIVPISSDDELVQREIRKSCKEVRDHLEGLIELPSAKDI